MKLRKIVFALCALFVLLALVACQPEPQVTIGKQAAGTEVTVRSDQMLVVELESNPTTGYRWGVAEMDEQVLKATGDPEYVSSARGEKLVGAGGVEVFQFQPVKPGETRLKLVYRRPWETDVEPVETFEVDVTVE